MRKNDSVAGATGWLAGPLGSNLAIMFNTNVMRCANRVGEAAPYVAIWRDE